jgi:urease accessory protein
VKAAAALVAEPGGGTITLPVLRSQAPLALRRTPDAVYLVGGAAGPIGGDTLELRIEVRNGAALRVRTAAAAVALPGRDGQESVLRITATVGSGARLEFLPEPTVVAEGARHLLDMRITLARGAALVLREEVILGRHGERGGRCRTRLRADYAGAPLLRNELDLGVGQASHGPAVLAGHRAAGSLLHVEPAWPAPPAACYAPGVAVMPLAGPVPAALITALAPDARTLRRLLGDASAVSQPADFGLIRRTGRTG